MGLDVSESTGSAEHFLDEHAPLAERRNVISGDLHRRYNTKRGLRNEDGTGVLIGLTEIGEVHGYMIEEQERVPDEGRLSYRGINIRDLVEGFQRDGRPGFEETAYLLLFGKLPTEAEWSEFWAVLGQHRDLPAGFTEDAMLHAASANIMNMLARTVLALYSYDDNPEALSIRHVLRHSVELIARFPTLVAYAYQAKRHYYHGESLYIHGPSRELSTAENLLSMIRPDQQYTELEAETLDLALVLHAEHGGGNNSAFTIHVVSSAATDTYSAISAGVGSLKGAKHGGANERVVGMMADVKEHVRDWNSEEQVADYIREIIKGSAHDRSGLVYGMGHAVYTLSDPRAVLLKEKARELAETKGLLEEFRLYDAVERLTPQVFREIKGTSRPIAANVDFYSGFVYGMLNIPSELFTPIFAVARISGWCAHRIEELVSGGRIIRPAYKNVLGKQPYTPMAER
jgi:citrate synthase